MSKHSIKLSIIVVSYNEADYLPECLDSILNQKVNFDYEIIIGDDGTSDNSLEIIKEYESKHKNITHFVQERSPNLNRADVIPSIRASAVMFSAMKMAQGKYLISFWHKQYIHCSCFLFRKLPESMLLAYPYRRYRGAIPKIVKDELEKFPSKNCTAVQDGVLYIKISE